MTPGSDFDAPTRADTPPRGGRLAGGLLVLLGVAVAAEASTFEVAFLTDPVGPKALPDLAAAVFVVAGVLLVIRPGPAASWPPFATLLRMGGAVAVFGSYALLLPPLGFVVSTTAAVTALAVLFGGPWKKAVPAALTLSAVLWYLFVWALGLTLPLGSLWRGLIPGAGGGS